MIFSGIDDQGNAIDDETCRKMFNINKSYINGMCNIEKEEKIKEVFDMYKDKYIKQYKVNYFLNTKEREYANVDLKKVITFDEFLRKIEEV